MAKGTRSDGLYEKKITIRGRQYHVYGRSVSELLDNEALKREEILNGYRVREDPTMSEYYERWIESRHGIVSEATIRGNNTIFKGMSDMIIPGINIAFKNMKIKEVTVDDLRYIQRTLSETHMTRGVNDAMALLKQILKEATNERILDYNPSLLIKPLKRTETQAKDTNHRALTIEEQQAFFGAKETQSSFYYNILRLAIYTGMRIGEITALKNSDIYGDAIHVERTITRTETHAYVIGDSAKTPAGRRTIPMNDNIRQVIKDQRELNRILDGNVINIDGTDDSDDISSLLFRSVNRLILRENQVNREIKRLCEITGIEHFTAHALRDTFATRAIESGTDPKTLQEILGHSDIAVTMNLYAHVMDNTKKAAMQNIIIAL